MRAKEARPGPGDAPDGTADINATDMGSGLAGPGQEPLFSIILPTRNRPALFAVALQSVLMQRFADIEVIVVNDGSSEEHEEQYLELVAQAPGMVRLLTLVRTERGHGQSYAVNFGAARAQGAYLCFLDDDDQWTDPDHLGRAARVIATSGAQADLILANQRAFLNGVALDRVVWIEDLEGRLHRPADQAGAYTVTTTELLECKSYCHRNTTIVSRRFFFQIGGLDEGLRYEEDREFYFRAIDQARSIRFLSAVVSRHNVPDPAARANMSTVKSALSRRLYQLRALDKAVLSSTRPELRRHAMRQRTYILQHIATEAAKMGRPDCALYYARQALMVRFQSHLAYNDTLTIGS